MIVRVKPNGSQYVVRGGLLLSSDDFIGFKLNRWTLISFAGYKNTKSKKVAFWGCKCDCGNIKDVNIDTLLRGLGRSCGCYYKEIKTVGRIPRRDASLSRKYSLYKYRANKCSIPFELTRKEFEEIVHENCFYCNREPEERHFVDSKGPKRRVLKWAYSIGGIDRKDNDLGYTIKNSVPCCTQCNRAKLDHSFNDFIKWIEKSYLFLKQKGTIS